VYGDGRSERLVAELRRQRKETIYVATKAGRRLNPHTAEGYNRVNLVAFVERSLVNLGVERIDLLQLHCPPNDVYYNPDVFQVLEDLVAAGKLQHYGVSVKSPEEGLKAMDFPNCQSVQIIFNMLRMRPAELFFAEAKKRRVGILARVPLASGLLSGKLTRQSTFAADDHRQFNRRGEAFDVGETFAGVDYETGLAAVDEVKALCPAGMSLAQFALRWILMFDAVTCAIPGAKRPSQAEENCAAADLPAISSETMEAIRRVYDERIRAQVHLRW
jgi:aryl-alcohol dehydrogenase-like predicted oxidoreductase